MTSNFVYSPPPQNSAPVDYNNSPYIGQFYAQPNSPFIPPLVLNGTSPYTTPVLHSAALPPSPNPNSAPLLHTYTSGDQQAYQHYVSPWLERRERRLSWNDQPRTLYRPPPVRQRTRSFDDSPFTPPAPYANLYPYAAPPPVPPILHPYLDGSTYRRDIVFDLAAPDFRPMRYAGNNQLWPLSHEELSHTATDPLMYKLTISCDIGIPEWPLHLDFRSSDPYNTNVPPIKLGDVLSSIYGALHKRISQHDWAKLTPEHEYEVSKAYTKRCKAMGAGRLTLLNQGVRQVDFLLGKARFRGLAKVVNSDHHFKLLVD